MKKSPYAGCVSKYKSVKTEGYASKAEARRAAELKLMERAGSISGLREQVIFELAPSVIVQGRKRPPLRYIADFAYIEDGQQVIEDVKGFRTDVYRIKRHLMATVHGIEIRET